MMSKLCLQVLLWLSIGLAPCVVVAADISYGKLLHDTECLVCHNPTHYTREPHKIHSWTELRKRVAYCRDDVGAEWDDVETENVVQYLNSFYKF